MLTTCNFDPLGTCFTPMRSSPASNLLRHHAAFETGPTRLLLLGVEDVGDILFTLSQQEENAQSRFEFTICSRHRANSARDIYLLTFISRHSAKFDDDGARSVSDIMWRQYFEFKIDPDSLVQMRDHAALLVKVSLSLDAWNDSEFGKVFKFTNSATLQHLRSFWSLYSCALDCSLDVSRGLHFTEYLRSCESSNQSDTDSSRVRGASIHAAQASQAVRFCHQHMWTSGASLSDTKSSDADLMFVNPLFCTPQSGEGVFQPNISTGYLSPFHFAHACEIENQDPDAIAMAITNAAKDEFRDWTSRFAEFIKQGRLQLMIHCGEELRLCHELQGLLVRMNSCMPKLYRLFDNHGSGDMLNLEEHRNNPLFMAYDVIDTSTLTDEVGLLAIIPATVPLLHYSHRAVLYTSTLHACDNSKDTSLSEMPGCDPLNGSILLGVLPDGFVNGYSTDPPIVVQGSPMGAYVKPARFTWRRTHSAVGMINQPYQAEVYLEPSAVQSVLYKWYRAMLDPTYDDVPWNDEEPRQASSKWRLLFDWSDLDHECPHLEEADDSGIEGSRYTRPYLYTAASFAALVRFLHAIEYNGEVALHPSSSGLNYHPGLGFDNPAASVIDLSHIANKARVLLSYNPAPENGKMDDPSEIGDQFKRCPKLDLTPATERVKVDLREDGTAGLLTLAALLPDTKHIVPDKKVVDFLNRQTATSLSADTVSLIYQDVHLLARFPCSVRDATHIAIAKNNRIYLGFQAIADDSSRARYHAETRFPVCLAGSVSGDDLVSSALDRILLSRMPVMSPIGNPGTLDCTSAIVRAASYSLGFESEHHFGLDNMTGATWISQLVLDMAMTWARHTSLGTASKPIIFAPTTDMTVNLLVVPLTIRHDTQSGGIILDVLILPPNPAMYDLTKTLKTMVQSTSNDQILPRQYNVPTKEKHDLLISWIVACVERCRENWTHNPQSCECKLFITPPPLPRPTFNTPLCHCGRGHNLSDVPAFWKPYQHFSYRAAFSMLYSGKEFAAMSTRKEMKLPMIDLDDPMKALELGMRKMMTGKEAPCGQCGKEGGGMKACARCKKVGYCGRECQKKGWKRHKKECASLCK
ncbi:hypothetical protein BDZ85DRAFT_316340 [Elsinoe ampelina]|uniref:MYND-type domain-containing protein n=1 Tax=Elsinoe ampelina TaxID=302913 RepID=A0A6A6GMU3_9PEZI|nr:hypothetical protein BDZ85DRAFT_316340 [Elsinoe ampelina]